MDGRERSTGLTPDQLPTPPTIRPFTPATGLYVNLATWGGAGFAMLGFDSQRTGATLYAHLRYTKVGLGNWIGWVGRYVC